MARADSETGTRGLEELVKSIQREWVRDHAAWARSEAELTAGSVVAAGSQPTPGPTRAPPPPPAAAARPQVQVDQRADSDGAPDLKSRLPVSLEDPEAVAAAATARSGPAAPALGHSESASQSDSRSGLPADHAPDSDFKLHPPVERPRPAAPTEKDAGLVAVPALWGARAGPSEPIPGWFGLPARASPPPAAAQTDPALPSPSPCSWTTDSDFGRGQFTGVKSRGSNRPRAEPPLARGSNRPRAEPPLALQACKPCTPSAPLGRFDPVALSVLADE